MSIPVALTPANRSGTCLTPLAALATETLAFEGAELADGVQVTVMLPDGSPLAIGTIAAGSADMNLNTQEAHRATIALPVGATTKAFLVVGDTDALRFVVPALLQRNYLDDVIPPTATVPAYPTSTELQAILDAVAAAETNAEGYASRASESAAEAESAKSAAQLANTQAQAANTQAQNAANKGVQYLATMNNLASLTQTQANKATEAADKAEDYKDVAKYEAELAQGYSASASNAAINAEAAEANAKTSAGAAAKAQEGAEEAEAGAEAAKEAAEIALNNGCVYKVVDLGSSSIIGLRRETTIYKIAPLGASSIDFTPPSLAAEEVIVFWLWVIMGATAHQLTFPSTVTWLSEGSFGANTETLLAFMSTDGGATWLANVQWEREASA